MLLGQSCRYVIPRNGTSPSIPHQKMARTKNTKKDQKQGMSKGKQISKLLSSLSPNNESRKPKRKRRYKPGTRALMEIRKYQKEVKLLMAKRPFEMVVKDVLDSIKPGVGYRVTKDCLLALQVCLSTFTCFVGNTGFELISFKNSFIQTKRKTPACMRWQR